MVGARARAVDVDRAVVEVDVDGVVGVIFNYAVDNAHLNGAVADAAPVPIPVPVVGAGIAVPGWAVRAMRFADVRCWTRPADVVQPFRGIAGHFGVALLQ